MKQVVQRRLPLDVKYTLLGRAYVPLLEGCGTMCANCGKLIANIATVKSKNGAYSIGFDCLETFLVNNSILDGFDADQHERIKKSIPKALRLAKHIRETNKENGGRITGVLFDKELWFGYFQFYYLTGTETNSRSNDSLKLKDVDYGFVIETLRNVLTEMRILVKMEA